MQEESVQINEKLANTQQYSDAMNAAMTLMYKGMDAAKMSSQEMQKTLESMGKLPPEGVSATLFAARVKAVARETIVPDDFRVPDGLKEGTFDLEKERGLKGWFDRNNGKGWVDCKKSSKGNLVPCGRKTAGKGAERSYPACRPTLSACNKKGTRRKKSSKPISWK